MDLGALVAGTFVALSLAAPPGPMNSLIARESTRDGFWPGFRVGVAAPIADTIYLAVLAFGFEHLLVNARILTAAAGVGAVLMLWFAWGAVKPGGSGDGRKVTFLGALAMGMTNPYQIGWWLTGGFHLVVSGAVEGIVGFLLGIFAWVFVFAWLCTKGAQKWSWFTPLVAILSADLLVGFSAVLALNAFGVDLLA